MNEGDPITIVHRGGSEFWGTVGSIERDRCVIQLDISGVQELWLTNTKTRPERRGTFRGKKMALWSISDDSLRSLLKTWGEKYLPNASASMTSVSRVSRFLPTK